MRILITPHYLPSLEYFVCLLPYDNILLEVQAHYQKQCYYNRCHILTSQKVDKLIIPIQNTHTKVKCSDVKIDYSQKWPQLHWRAISTAYRRAPYFEYFADHFHRIFLKAPRCLLDFNLSMLTTCLQLLQLEKKIELTTCYKQKVAPALLDARSLIHLKTPYQAHNFYQPAAYQQVFGSTFVPNLSIIDLLFCQGPNANTILQASAKKLCLPKSD